MHELGAVCPAGGASFRFRSLLSVKFQVRLFVDAAGRTLGLRFPFSAALLASECFSAGQDDLLLALIRILVEFTLSTFMPWVGQASIQESQTSQDTASLASGFRRVLKGLRENTAGRQMSDCSALHGHAF